MQLTFDVLERALSPIEDLGKEELTFPINGIPVTLKVLTPEEENEVHRFSTSNITGEDESLAAATSFLEKLKLGVLSYGIIAVGEHDFHTSPFVETDEVLAGGKKVRVPRHMAMRDLIKRWPGAIRSALFRKYIELLGKVEEKAEAAIQFEPSDRASEIERLEKRLKELREEKDSRIPDAFTDLLRTAADAEEENAAKRAARREARIEEEEAEPVPQADQPQEPTPAVRRPIQPVSAVPPESAPTPVAPKAAAPAAAQPRHPQPPAEEEDSFVDLSDMDAVQKAMDRENSRLMAMRRGVPVPEPPSAIGRTAPLTKPPHLDAVETLQGMSDRGQEEIQHPTEIGTVGDRQVFRMPVQELTERPGAPANKTRAPQVNATGDGKGTQNPRFSKPKT